MERTGVTKSALWVVSFAEADESQRFLLGGKGAGLAAMTTIGLPVPPGFIVTTEACGAYYASGGILPDQLWSEVESALADLEMTMGRGFGDPAEPLLLSVRSGGPFSMPGMMDTILDLGMNDATVSGLAALAGDETFAWDAYRRFIQMYADVVLGLDRSALHQLPEEPKAAVMHLKTFVESETGQPIPEDPKTQLRESTKAVFRSWMNKRAIDYRASEGIADDLYTAVNVQAMVFGNIGTRSGTGVVFTRDPTNGESKLWGEYLPKAQGEDIVAGLRTPLPIAALSDDMPEMYDELDAHGRTLEKHFKDMQDMEFTVESGKLWILQTRRGKRAGRSAVRAAVEMAEEGLITRSEAVARVQPSELDELLHPLVDASDSDVVFGSGLAASPGGASGMVVFTADEAERLASEGHKVVLLREETSPDDFHGMIAAEAVVTVRGGMTSHAAVVARGIGITCVVGCSGLTINETAGTVTSDSAVVSVGDVITVDGSNGLVYLGQVPTVEPVQDEYFATILEWADAGRRLGVHANADTPKDAARARALGAEGIGLCRTEHMFFDPGRVEAVRAMIMASDNEARADALAVIEPLQASDFEAIFKEMDGLPVTIRLLDPPLHEFLPDRSETFERIVRAEAELDKADNPEIVSHVDVLRALLERTDRLAEVNPMLGQRGARLGVIHPEITHMQAKAIFTAAIQAQRAGVSVDVEIMVPLVAFVSEYLDQKALITAAADEVFERLGSSVHYKIGSMIELPRAALIAGDIAAESDFLSFGTNDLTQTALGLSRDDSSKFLPTYLTRGLIETDPFVTIDILGVGRLVEMAVASARAANPSITLGICGEHGGDPASVEFFDAVGLEYVSCSPYRVPIARLSAAHSAIHSSEIGDS